MLEIERTMPSKNFSTSCKWTKLEYRICELNSMGFRVELDSNSDHFPWSSTHTVRHMIFLQKLVKSLILNGVLTREFYDSISISKRDFQLLHLKKFTTDTIVDFNIKLSFIVLVFINYLKKIKPADESIHFFNSFFFRKLADFDENQLQMFEAKESFERVRKWTKKVNIFQKDYIFIHTSGECLLFKRIT